MTSSTTNNKTSAAVNFAIENNILKGAVEPIDNEKKLGQVILDVLNKNPNHVYQIDAETGEQTTYKEMKDRSIRCALWLKKLGIGPKDVVVACTHTHLNSYIPLVATFFVDAISTAWNYNITIHSARRYMNQFMPKIIFTCEKAADVLIEAAKLENLNVDLVVFGNHSSLPSLIEIINNQTTEEIDNFIVVNAKSPREVALITLSSGSTGFPKGVMRSSASQLVHLHFTIDSPDIPQIFLWDWPLDWGVCVAFIIETIITKQTQIVTNHIDRENFFQIIDKYKVNYAHLPSALVSYAAQPGVTKNCDIDSLKTIMVTGRKFSEDELASLKRNIPTATIQNIYGGSEIGLLSYSTPASKHAGSVGFIVANVQVKIVDLIFGKNLGPNQYGEVCTKSPAAMVGYYNDPEATKQAFDEEGWYRTGDIGYYDETGEIFIVDRIKEMIKYRSHHVSPIEIEEILLSHPEVQEAVVVALPHKLDGDWPLAFCKTVPGSKVTEDDLLKLTSVLEDYKKLRGGIHFIDSFQYTSSGKIARNEMKLLAKKTFNLDG